MPYKMRQISVDKPGRTHILSHSRTAQICTISPSDCAAVISQLPPCSWSVCLWVALANDDIREGLYRLRFQFSSDNVTIEATPESTTEQGDDNAASEGFHAYKWKEVPEGYEVVYEEEDATLQFYMVNFENKNGNYIDYSQANIENSQHYISYDSQEGYKRIIELTDEIEAYSISDGRNNTIFYEKKGYLFDFMSDQPEETILEYIEMSGILEYEN